MISVTATTITPHWEDASAYSEIEEDVEADIEDYLMNMTSLSNNSQGKSFSLGSSIEKNLTLDKPKVTSQPVIETVEREISRDIKQYNTKIVEEDPCSGKKTVKRVSHVLNKKTGTVISVERTDYMGGCPLKDKNLLDLGAGSNVSKR